MNYFDKWFTNGKMKISNKYKNLNIAYKNERFYLRNDPVL